jgi:cytochrome c556
MARLRAARLLLLALACAAGAGCYQDPEQAIAQEQAMTDIGDAVNQLALQTAELTAQVDSLSRIIAKQDTAIYRMANVTGVPYQR